MTTTDEARQLAAVLYLDGDHDDKDTARLLRQQADEIDRLNATIATLLAVPDETQRALVGREALDPFEEGIGFGIDQTYRRMASALTEQVTA